MASARVAVDRLRAHRAMRRGAGVVAAESLRRGAVAAAALETGRLLSPTRDQRLLSTHVDSDVGPDVATDVDTDEGWPPADAGPVDEVTARAVRGAGRAYGELSASVGAWAHSPLQVLARLHLLAAKELVGPELLGRPGSGADAGSSGPYDAVLGDPLEPTLVAQRLDALRRLLGSTSAPALVVAAVVHGEIATLRPFAWGNHVVALAAQRLTLSTRGLDPGSQVAVEVGHLLATDDYRQAVAAYGSGTPAGIVEWIRHCGSAVESGAREGLAICESLGR